MTTISGGGGTGAAVGRYYDQLVERQKDLAAEQVLDGPERGGDDGVGGRVAGYYESASASFWMGAGAVRLGLSGVPGKWDIARLVDGVDAAGVQLGRKFGDASARAFDVTFSVQKEVSILWAAAGPELREVIEQAVVDAATAVLDDQVGARAATRMRTGPDGEFLAADKKPVMVAAEGPAVAIIPEFTSRLGDPQLHVHALVSSKVWEPTTERWLALDARELKQDQRAMSALFHAGLEAKLSQDIGVTWGTRDYYYARTIDGIDDTLIDVFSQRRADVDARLETKLARFEETLGHAPTPQQRWKLEREAAVDSRPGKSAEHLDFTSWQTTIETHTAMTPEMLVASVTGNTDVTHSMTQRVLDDMIDAAVGELSDTRSSWTRGDFKAELARVLPPDLAVTPAQLVAFINTQTDAALADMLPVTPATVDRPNRRWTAPDILAQETRILDRIERATQIEVAPKPVGDMHLPEWLDGLQAAAAARVASESKFELVVGLAGAGKTSMLSAAVGGLYIDDRDVFGLAPSAVAAEVLGAEIDMSTENIHKFLWEHTQRNNGPSEEFRMGPGGTLIIDEAGMVSTPQWDALTQLAQTNNWRIVAVGDGYQFAAVGRGGIFDHLANTLPDHRISRLEQVHRFDQPWEANASASLRQGDTSILDVYEQHDRIIATGAEQDLVDVVTGLYLDRHNTGVDVGVFAATNQQVAELNTSIQTALADLGQLGQPITGSGLFVGDVIETRQNDRELTTDTGQFVKNRDRWTITNTTPNDGLVVTGTAGTVTLPDDYVAEHVNLAYAQTSHASQGRTIAGTSIYAYDPNVAPADRAGIYVPMTRGREENLAVVAADTVPIAKAHLADAISRRWIDTPAITHLHDQPAEPVALIEQVDTAKTLLGDFEQQTLFDTAVPSPTVRPDTPEPDETRRATRSEAQERQQQHHQPVEPIPVPVLSPAELIDKLAVVDRLAWPVENADVQRDRVEADYRTTRSQLDHAITAHNDLTATYNDHLDKMPLVRGRKKWDATFDRYERDLDRSQHNVDHLKDRLNNLKTEHTNWGQYRSLTTQLDLSNAQNALTQDRQHRGHQAVTDPAMIARLGPPPTQPAALDAWHQAAGAIEQHTVFSHHRYNPEHDLQGRDYAIGQNLKTSVRTATQTLGQHVGIEQVPDLQPKTLDRTIEGPSLGL